MGAVATAILLLALRAAVTVRDADIVDFRCFWEAGRLVRELRDPYDSPTWAFAVYQDPSRVPHCAGSFVYPLPTALAMVPFSLVPEPAALAIWEALLLAAVLASVALIARTWPMYGGAHLLIVVVLWSQPMFSAVASGQFGPIVLFGFAALAFALERRHARAALASWWLLLVKPHLTAFVLAGTLAARGALWALVAIAGGLVVFAVSIAIAPAWPFEFVREAFGQRLLADLGLASLWTLALVVGLPPIVGGLVALLCVAIGVALLPRRRPGPHELVAILVAATFVLTPYARPHDLDALAVCWAVALAYAKAAEPLARRLAVAAVVIVAVVLPWTIMLLTQIGVPLATYVAVALASGALTVFALRRAPVRLG